MPPKKPKHPQGDEPQASTDTLVVAVPVPTAVTVMLSSSSSSSQSLPVTPTAPTTRTTRSTPTHQRSNTNDDASTSYESPLKKLKKVMSSHNRRLIESVEDLRDFITHNYVMDPEIRGSDRIQTRLLWTVNETIHSLRFLHLYLGEEREPELLHEQQAIYMEAQRDDAYEANQFLSLYDIAAENPSFPQQGDIISFVPAKLRLYRNCCQVETKLQHIVPVTRD